MTLLYTGQGFWDPIAWLFGTAFASILVYWIWSKGRGDYKKGTEQVKPFLCGNPEPGKSEIHVRASNIYWGFVEALKGYYEPLIGMHTGELSDYVGWFIGGLALLTFVILVV